MNRRAFLLGSAVAALGCGRKVGQPIGTTGDVRVLDANAARKNHLDLLQRFAVKPDAVRTTPKAPADVLKVAPELKGLVKVSVRLNPRFGPEPAEDQSKLGGQFWNPASEKWPTATNGSPFAPILQLRAEDAPPNWAFLPEKDLFQLFWHPSGPRPDQPAVRWLKRSEAKVLGANPPLDEAAILDFVPVPCRLFPERIMEFPNLDALPKGVRERIDAWKPEPLELKPEWGPPDEAVAFTRSPSGPSYFSHLLSTADGTKVGGYPYWVGIPKPPSCDRCRWGMDFLLTIAAEEWTPLNWPRWMPFEEREGREATRQNEYGYRRAAGFDFGEQPKVHVWMCRRCEGWPVKLV